ncbi:MAG: hypothetical protein AB8H79_21435 [Myxococcota bacterium]
MKRPANRTLSILLALSLSQGAKAQSVLVLEGESLPGVGTVTSIENLAVDSSGRWWVEVDTTGGPAILRDGAVYLTEGDLVSDPPGATVRSFDAVGSTDGGDVLYSVLLDNTPGGTSDDDAVYWNDTLVLRAGDAVGAMGVGMGTLHSNIADVQVTGNRKVLVRGFFDDPNVPGTTDFFCLLLELDATGAILSETRIAGEGDVPPGQSLVINTIRTGSHAAAVNALGEVIWCADLDTASLPGDAIVYLGNTVLAQEDQPTGFGAIWDDLVSPEVDLNEAGDWTIKDRADGDNIIVRNGQSFRREGDSLPDIAPFTFEYFGNGPADLTQDGRVLWFGRWSDPDSDRDEGLFLEDELIVQEGVSVIGGWLVNDVGDQSDNYRVSPNGEWILFEASVDDGGVTREGAFLVDVALGVNYCISVANSTGQAASISGTGSASVLQNDLLLSAGPIPAGQPGLFFYGPETTLVPFGNGFRCIGGVPLARLAVEATNAGGVLQHALDNTLPPTAASAIQPGSTWYFQAWFRDPAGAGQVFNLSDGLELMFLP